MKRKEIKISNKVGGLLSEAMRRIYYLSIEKKLDDKFSGLGSPSMYKQGVISGLFVPSFPPETPRVCNWYTLTPLGQKVIKQMARKGRCPKSCQDMNNYILNEVTVYIES